MYEDRTQSYDPEIHKEYLLHDTTFPLPHHLQTVVSYKLIRLKGNNILCDCEFKIWIFKVFL